MSSRYAKNNTDSVAANDAALHFSGSNLFPDYPREKVNSKEYKDYWDCLDTIIDSHETFGHLQRGVMPSSWLKYQLADTTGLTVLAVPAATNAKYIEIVKHNTGVQKVFRDNQARTMQVTALTEAATRTLAAQCQASLRTHAPLLLLSLQEQCKVKASLLTTTPKGSTSTTPAIIDYTME